jgi:hypothetical protein
MSFTTSDLVVETVEKAACVVCMGSRGFPERAHRCVAPQRELGVGARAARGGGGVRGRGGDHGRVGGVRGELRPREPAPDQRPCDAHRSRVPVLAIAAHVPTSEIGTNYFQETHPQVLLRECSAYCELVSTPAQFPFVLDTAVRTALERRGVAVLVVPGDVLVAEIRRPRVIPAIRATAPVVRPSDRELDVAAGALDAAERVTTWRGRVRGRP